MMNYLLITSLLSSFLLTAIPLCAQWSLVSTETTTDLFDVHFSSDSTGYAVGDYGLILKSTDQGNSWISIHSDSSEVFNSVFFLNPDTGFVAGYNIYKTTNGGVNWSIVFTDTVNTFSPFNEVYFVNHNIGFAGKYGVYRTLNGGSTWQNTEITSGYGFNSIHFPSDSVGYFIGGSSPADPIYKTVDGGDSYLQLANEYQSIKESTWFLNDTVGYMCGWYGGMLVKTINGGMSWNGFNTSNELQCWDVYFADEQTGYYIANGGGSYHIYKTTNGGSSWTAQIEGDDLWLQAFHFIDSHTALAVGGAGIIYRLSENIDVGQKETEAISDVTVYPNPVTSTITIDLSQLSPGYHKITLLSSKGQLIQSISTSENPLTLDLHSLASGLYFISVLGNEGQQRIKKFVKR